MQKIEKPEKISTKKKRLQKVPASKRMALKSSKTGEKPGQTITDTNDQKSNRKLELKRSSCVKKAWKLSKKAANIEKPLRIRKPYETQNITTSTHHRSLRDLEKTPKKNKLENPHDVGTAWKNQNKLEQPASSRIILNKKQKPWQKSSEFLTASSYQKLPQKYENLQLQEQFE